MSTHKSCYYTVEKYEDFIFFLVIVKSKYLETFLDQLSHPTDGEILLLSQIRGNFSTKNKPLQGLSEELTLRPVN